VKRSRLRIRRLGGILAASLFILAAIPGVATAAVPTLTPTWSVIPTTVGSGDYVAFRGQIRNDDSSTVSQLYLVELASRDPNLILDSVAKSQGTCDTTGATFVCSLGQLKPHKTATVTAIFKTRTVVAPATGYSAIESLVFNTTGLGSTSGGDNSHGDSWPSGPLPAQVTTSGDFGGRYVLTSTLKVVENNQALSNANPHSTRAYAPVTGIGVTVEDVDCTIETPDPICALFTTGSGQVSKVNVNDGQDVSGTPGTTLLHFYIQADASEIPSGKNANNLFVTHVYDEATLTPVTETISTRCLFAKKAPTPTNAPCITVTNLGGGDLGVDVWTFHNGGMKL
jgi:hypothetical protein